MPTIVEAVREQVPLADDAVRDAEARAAQTGTRLETALLQAGVVSEAELERALSDCHRMPAAGAAELASVPAEVYGLLTTEQARRYGAVPFATGAQRVDVAVGGNLTLDRRDELAFVLSQRVRLFVASEPRLEEALHRYFGLPLSAATANLLDRLDRGGGRLTPSRPEDDGEPILGAVLLEASSEESAAAPERPAADDVDAARLRRRKLSPESEPEPRRKIQLTEAERRALSDDATASPSPAPAAPRSEAVPADLADLDHQLRDGDSPTAVCNAFLDRLANDFPTAVLLRPEGELLRGWLGRAAGSDLPWREVMTGPELAAEWRRAVADSDWAEIELGTSAVASGITGVLEAERGAPAVLAPIRVRDQLVCLAVGAGATVDSRRAALIRQAAILTGLALERWILRRRGRSTAPSSEDA